MVRDQGLDAFQEGGGPLLTRLGRQQVGLGLLQRRLRGRQLRLGLGLLAFGGRHGGLGGVHAGLGAGDGGRGFVDFGRRGDFRHGGPERAGFDPPRAATKAASAAAKRASKLRGSNSAMRSPCLTHWLSVTQTRHVAGHPRTDRHDVPIDKGIVSALVSQREIIVSDADGDSHGRRHAKHGPQPRAAARLGPVDRLGVDRLRVGRLVVFGVIHVHTLDVIFIVDFQGSPVAVLTGLQGNSRVRDYSLGVVPRLESNSGIVCRRGIHFFVSHDGERVKQRVLPPDSSRFRFQKSHHTPTPNNCSLLAKNSVSSLIPLK